MRRVLFALIGEAACFAVLVWWLDIERVFGGAKQGAFGVFVGVIGAGLPALYYCCKNRLWEYWRAVMLGALCGVLCALPFAGGPFNSAFLFFLFAVAGVLFGTIFWLAAIWRNDDLTCPKSFCLPCGKVYRVARNALLRAPQKYR